MRPDDDDDDGGDDDADDSSKLCDLLLFNSGSRSSQDPRGSWKSLLL